ncbi:MAG TPA: hypothetical protein VEE87_00045 [archaeon]|nr:hypothetical protein [archaeon]
MISGAAGILVRLSCISLIACAFAHGQCPVDSVIVKGRVESAPRSASVRVQLVYAKEIKGESAEATLDGATFNIPIEFLTQSRKPVLLGNLRTKCDRKPATVIVTLVEGDQEDDRVSLDFIKDFKTDGFGVYTLRSEVTLKARQP